ncbi:MAG: aspartate/glutamate racemase family protein [Oscillospiraceae bacterium]|jgi:aspartate racemase|uniref:aspartate/glutamate racemase family protein n=1 Tax=Candidatus Pseudoscillospira sp. SGI.172 TaxID=3420582 RepID=UPI0009BB64A9
MKTIGLIGGMSWESTVTYYQIVNHVVQQRLGGLHSARLLLDSLDFAEIEACQSSGDWEKSARLLTDAALRLEGAGADLVLICTNTMHKVAPQVQAALRVPLLHIADATAEALRAAGVDTVALLGTKYTMCQDFYTEKLIAAGIRVLIPDEPDVELVNRVIFDELCLGILKEGSRQEFLRVINALAQKGARGVILGCTEIGLLVSQADTPLPVFDTTLIHATRAAELALG